MIVRAEGLTGDWRADAQVPEAADSGLEHPVQLNVLGEVIKLDMDGSHTSVPSFQLLVEANSSAHRREGVVFDPIALQNSAPQRGSDGSGERRNHRLDQ